MPADRSYLSGAGIPGLVPGTVRLVGPGGRLVSTLVVAGEGTWRVEPAGVVAATFQTEILVTGSMTDLVAGIVVASYDVLGPPPSDGRFTLRETGAAGV